jgi:hypothetical protein
MTLDEAREAFRENPSNPTAGDYLATAVEYASDDMMGDDEWIDAIAEVIDYLGHTPAWSRDGR